MDFERHLIFAWERGRPHIVALVLMTLVMFVLSAITFGLLGPVLMAGFTHAILLMVRLDRKPEVKDLFAQMRLLIPLLVFFALAAVVIFFCFLLLVVPGIVVSVVFAYLTLYFFLLVTDRRMGMFDAFKTSASMVTSGNLLDQIIVAAIYIGANAISFPLAIIVLPLSTAFLASVYESLDRTPVNVDA